ncbi:MAG: hypothetical protein MJ180_01130 [Candidatus Gastranaerophilales bacterium]|nr:hypothetical protein [Candidatus Gastranaerophilales bacterium]
MQTITKEVRIKKTLNNSEIEKQLSQYGEPLRWAVVDVLEEEFLIDGVFIKED